MALPSLILRRLSGPRRTALCLAPGRAGGAAAPHWGAGCMVRDKQDSWCYRTVCPVLWGHGHLSRPSKCLRPSPSRALKTWDRALELLRHRLFFQAMAHAQDELLQTAMRSTARDA